MDTWTDDEHVTHIEGWISRSRERIAQGRALASRLGDTEAVWTFLDRVATLERLVNSIEAKLAELKETLEDTDDVPDDL